jgi:hypothetical protein
MVKKLQESVQIELAVFLAFNRIKSILGGNVGSEEENL